MVFTYRRGLELTLHESNSNVALLVHLFSLSIKSLVDSYYGVGPEITVGYTLIHKVASFPEGTHTHSEAQTSLQKTTVDSLSVTRTPKSKGTSQGIVSQRKAPLGGDLGPVRWLGRQGCLWPGLMI